MIHSLIGILLIIVGIFGVVLWVFTSFFVEELETLLVTIFLALVFLGITYLGYKLKNKNEGKISNLKDSSNFYNDSKTFPNNLVDELINNAQKEFESIGKSDKIYSWFKGILHLFLYLFLFLMLPISILLGVVETTNFPVWIFLILCGIIFLFFISKGLYLYGQYDFTHRPIFLKIYDFRTIQLLNFLKTNIKTISKASNKYYVKLNNEKDVTIKYDLRALMLFSFIGPLGAFKSNIDSSAYFVQIEGKNTNLTNNVQYAFSARKKDQSKFDVDGITGYGVFPLKKQYQWYSYLIGPELTLIENEDTEISKVKNAIKKSIEGTNLKGELQIKDGKFKLQIYDNISTAMTNKKIQYKSIDTENKLEHVPDSQKYCYGIDKLINTIFDL
jgi:hypothetical protein